MYNVFCYFIKSQGTSATTTTTTTKIKLLMSESSLWTAVY